MFVRREEKCVQFLNVYTTTKTPPFRVRLDSSRSQMVMFLYVKWSRLMQKCDILVVVEVEFLTCFFTQLKQKLPYSASWLIDML